MDTADEFNRSSRETESTLLMNGIAVQENLEGMMCRIGFEENLKGHC